MRRTTASPLSFDSTPITPQIPHMWFLGPRMKLADSTLHLLSGHLVSRRKARWQRKPSDFADLTRQPGIIVRSYSFHILRGGKEFPYPFPERHKTKSFIMCYLKMSSFGSQRAITLA